MNVTIWIWRASATELVDRIVASGADVERINAPLAALVLEVPGHYSTESRPVFMVP